MIDLILKSTNKLHFSLDHILSGNLNKKSIMLCFSIKIIKLWYGMFIFSANLNDNQNMTTFDEILYQPIWLNSHHKFC